MEKKELRLEEIEINIGWNRDPVGFLFHYDNRVFRAINKYCQKNIMELFDCGLVDELNESELIPRTKISEFVLENYDLILEHEKINVVTYPPEWSFRMLQDAALTVIKLNKILLKYGYETKDAHSYNILFDGPNPKFIDFGSFSKRFDSKYWICKGEFVRFYTYPLFMWSKGNEVLARKILADSSGYIDAYEFNLYKYFFLRLLPQSLLKKYFIYYEYLKNLSRYDIETIRIVKHEKLKRYLLRILFFISKLGLLPNSHANLSRLQKKVARLKPPRINSLWGNYHSVTEKKDAFAEGSRFDLVIKLIQKYNIKETLEIGGNQGLLSRHLVTIVDKVICSDYDSNAVDQMYLKSKEENVKITPVLLNLLRPFLRDSHNAANLSPFVRLNSQAVLALAITHHLILTQKVPIDIIFESLGMYGNEYLFVEFMPKGVGNRELPDWYNVDWFRENFEKYYKLLDEVVTTKDGGRILFLGKKLRANL
jgi:hypothetical protein